MEINRYGIKLTRVREEHIEEIRVHRNEPAIRDFMEYQEYISEEMQKKWFDSLDPATDFYFRIEYNGKGVGLIHTSSIDWSEKSGHAGLFLWDKQYLSTHIPVLASLSMVDFFFFYCTLDKIYAKVLRSNSVAINYNKYLGFSLVSNDDGRAFQEYIMTKESYCTATERLHSLADRIHHENYQVKLENSIHRLLTSQGGIDLRKEEVFVELVN